jgi:hypothetical protein
MIGGTTARGPGRRSRPARPVTRRAAPSAVRGSARPSTETARQQVAPRRRQAAPRRQSSYTPPPNVRSFAIPTLSRVFAVGRLRAVRSDRNRPFSAKAPAAYRSLRIAGVDRSDGLGETVPGHASTTSESICPGCGSANGRVISICELERRIEEGAVFSIDLSPGRRYQPKRQRRFAPTRLAEWLLEGKRRCGLERLPRARSATL